jgi:hypothetical protein
MLARFRNMRFTELLSRFKSDEGSNSSAPTIHQARISRLGSLTTYDLPPCPGGCDGMTAIMRSSDPGFFIFGSKIANPSRLEM